jgi:hypothetical protein
MIEAFIRRGAMTLCGLAAVGSTLVWAQAEPARYPHDMSEYGCTHRDGSVCDQAPAPAPDFNPLVGTWVRFSLVRNGFSVQPPDAPLYVKFMSDGYWSMMEFPAGRPKVARPLEQQTSQELFSRFDKMEGGWGNYNTNGMVNFRHHKAGLGPGGGEMTQARAWHFDGNSLVLSGTTASGSPIIHARKLPNQPLESKALVGSWQRTSYALDGVPQTSAPEYFLLGEDGWYHATALPPRQRPSGAMQDWTPEQYAQAFAGMSASRGTYAISGSTLARRHIGDTDPNLEDHVSRGTFTRSGDTFTWEGVDAAGRRFRSTYTKLPTFDVYATYNPN